MQKFVFLLPMVSLLTACVTPVVDSAGKAVPVVVQTPTPTVVIDNRTVQKTDPNAPIFVCSVKPFMETFKSENVNRGKAILETQKQCLAKNDEMFCEVKDIQCTEYKQSINFLQNLKTRKTVRGEPVEP